MNPGPTEIVELFTFVVVTLSAALAKTKAKKVNKVEVAVEDQPKGEPRSWCHTQAQE